MVSATRGRDIDAMRAKTQTTTTHVLTSMRCRAGPSWLVFSMALPQGTGALHKRIALHCKTPQLNGTPMARDYARILRDRGVALPGMWADMTAVECLTRLWRSMSDRERAEAMVELRLIPEPTPREDSQ
jgi:hypothetical protein